MSDLDELIALRPLVSQLRHDLEQERRDHGRTKQQLDAEIVLTAQLRAQLVALRDAQRVDETPALGSRPVETSAVVRRNREHG